MMMIMYSDNHIAISLRVR